MGKDDHMILAKGVEYGKFVRRPFAMSLKIDGVPGRYLYNRTTMSRDNKPLVSDRHIVTALQPLLSHIPTTEILGELHKPGATFQVSSGLARRHAQSPMLHLGLWDIALRGTWYRRIQVLQQLLKENPANKVFVVPFVRCYAHSAEEVKEKVLEYFHELQERYGYVEGVVLRYMDGKESLYRIGRSWGLSRYVPKPSLDLRVIGIEEAIAGEPKNPQDEGIRFLGETVPTGTGLRAVGRIVVSYKGNPVGVGPGCMTHKMRRYYWENPKKLVGTIVKVEYKLDRGYKKLRQPIFAGERPDKHIPDA